MLKTPKTPANASVSLGTNKSESLDAVVPTPPQSEIKAPASPDNADHPSASATSAPLIILETPSKTHKPSATSRKRSNNIVFVQTPSSASSASSSASSTAGAAYTGTYKFEMVTPVRKPNGSGFAFISHSPTTFPLLQPEIDDLQLARRKRRRTSPTELQILEDSFNHCMKPSRASRENIARRVGMNEKAVQIWFQNRRQAFRKQEIINGISPSALAPQKKTERGPKGLEYDMQNLSPAVELIMRKHIAIAPKTITQSSEASKDDTMEDDTATYSATATTSEEEVSDFANSSKQASPVPLDSRDSSPTPAESNYDFSAPATESTKSALSAHRQSSLGSVEFNHAANSTELTESIVRKEFTTPIACKDSAATQKTIYDALSPQATAAPQTAIKSYLARERVGSIPTAVNKPPLRAQKFLTEEVSRGRIHGANASASKPRDAKHEKYKSASLVSNHSFSSDDGSNHDNSNQILPSMSTALDNQDSLRHRAFKLPSIEIAFKAKSAGFTIYNDNSDDTDGEETTPIKQTNRTKRQLAGLPEKRESPASASVHLSTHHPSLARLSMLSNGQAQIVFEGTTVSNSISGSSHGSATPVAAAGAMTTVISSVNSLTDDDTESKAPAKVSSYNPEVVKSTSNGVLGAQTPVATSKDAAKSAASLLRSRLSQSISKAQQFLASADPMSGIVSHGKSRAAAASISSSTPPGSPSKRKRLLMAAVKRSPLSPRKLGLLPQPKVGTPKYGVIPKFNAGSLVKGKSSGSGAGDSSKPGPRDSSSFPVASFAALPKSRSFTSALLMRHQAPSLLGLAPATATGKSLAAAKRHHATTTAAAAGVANGRGDYPRYQQPQPGSPYQSSSSSSDSSPPPKTLVNNHRFQLALAEKKKKKTMATAAIYVSNSSCSSRSSNGGSSGGGTSSSEDDELQTLKTRKLQRHQLHQDHHHHQVDNNREAECINNLLSLRSGDWA
ncbi:hypothetical protein D0Z00_002599 [Geotrichum galactomycetum]|uniref:Uncharacterized protein n=1 Tax=Geotrichum galactomycetum TaxID=27317 RepID=A0ACB6V3S4_9ASCO|nr:hypothetical protein D0Z00_002599 [Geotrichum candidum]